MNKEKYLFKIFIIAIFIKMYTYDYIKICIKLFK